jgi:hypothetical protein
LGCPTLCPVTFIANGKCDPECNVAACVYDGYDCRTGTFLFVALIPAYIVGAGLVFASIGSIAALYYMKNGKSLRLCNVLIFGPPKTTVGNNNNNQVRVVEFINNPSQQQQPHIVQAQVVSASQSQQHQQPIMQSQVVSTKDGGDAKIHNEKNDVEV